jgi:hypothetical protein
MIYQPNRWSCLPTAWSYLINWPLWSIIKAIGHDGSHIQWPELPEPYCRRGFHPQELIYLGDRFGFVTTAFEPNPVLISGSPLVITNLQNSFERILKSSDGVLLGETNSGARHAIAWMHMEILDPDYGQITDLADFSIQTFYRIKSKWW